MRIIIQRVREARVAVTDAASGAAGEERTVGEIGPGLCVLVGVTHTDGVTEAEKTAKKICELKLLRNAAGEDDPKSRLSVSEAGAKVLLVSQFTLYASVKKGTKPSWSHAAPADKALPLFNRLAEEIRSRGVDTETGEFGAHMNVYLTNDGPFTIFYEV